MTETLWCDVNVVELARSFLSDEGLDTKENVQELAVEIQMAIEDYIAGVHDANSAKERFGQSLPQ